MRLATARILAAALILVFLLSGCGVGKKSEEPVIIALVNSLTGEAASTGIYVQRGVELAVSEWNSRGGINGRAIQLVTEDDTGQAAGAVNGFKKVTQQQKPLAVLLPNYSNMVMAVLPYLSDAKVPCLTGATNPKITSGDKNWIFRFRTSDAMMGKLLAEYALKISNKVAIIHDTNEFGTGGMESLKAAFATANVTPLANEGYNTGDKDFTAQLLRIKASGAKVLCGWGHPLEDGLIMKQIKDIGIDIQLVGAAPYGQPVALDLAKDAAEGLAYVQEYCAFDPDPRVQEFAKKYNNKYNQVSEFNAACYYDAINMVLDTIQRYNVTNALGMRDALEKVSNFQGVTGIIGFDSNHEGFRKAVIVKVEKGIPTVIDKIELTAPK